MNYAPLSPHGTPFPRRTRHGCTTHDLRATHVRPIKHPLNGTMDCPWSPHEQPMDTTRTDTPWTPADCPWTPHGCLTDAPRDCPCRTHGRSTECPRSVHRLSTGFPRTLHGLPADCLRVVHGLSRAYPRTPHGLSTDTPRTAHGRPTDCPWTPHRCSVHTPRTFQSVGSRRGVQGLPIRCPWTVRRVCVDSTWGVRRHPWGASHGPMKHCLQTVDGAPWNVHRRLIQCLWAPHGYSGPSTPRGRATGTPRTARRHPMGISCVPNGLSTHTPQTTH